MSAFIFFVSALREESISITVKRVNKSGFIIFCNYFSVSNRIFAGLFKNHFQKAVVMPSAAGDDVNRFRAG
jgi:hypothetical protein